MKVLIVAACILFSSVLLTGCVAGNYVSTSTGKTQTVTQAPMKLKLCRKARWTYYGYSNSAVFMYYETAKYRKKGDTIFMHSRIAYGDTSKQEKLFVPSYVVSGDSLISLEHSIAYIRKKKAKE